MKKYQITDPAYFSTDPKKLRLLVARSLRKQRADFVVFRDKSMGTKKKERVLQELAKIAPRFRAQFLVSGDWTLAKKYSFGVHLSSKQHKKISQLKREGMFVVVSTHSLEELQFAIQKRANLATFSPIFPTPNKGEPKGVESLNLIHDKIKPKVIALGGIISRAHIKKLRGTGVYGFASIRYFVK